MLFVANEKNHFSSCAIYVYHTIIFINLSRISTCEILVLLYMYDVQRYYKDDTIFEIAYFIHTVRRVGTWHRRIN